MRTLLSSVAACVAMAAAVPALGATPAAPTAPTASTGSASSITERSADVAGTLSSNGAATSFYFEYGTSSSYGSQTATRTAGPKQSGATVSAHISGLAPGTTYHFALVATNSAGTTNGGDQSFSTTTPPAPGATTGSATSVTEKTASLTGSVTPNGTPTTYYFDYGTSTAYGAQTQTRSAGAGNTSVNVSAPVSGLTPGASYHFRLVATSSSGTTDGTDQTFTTTAAPAPVVVTGAASSISGKGAILAGSVTPNGTPTSYYFEYGSSTSYGKQTATRNAGAGTAAQDVSALVSGLTSGSGYHFRLVATNASGTTDGSDAAFTTSAAPAPLAVTGSATAITGKSAQLTGSVTANGAATSYYFDYGTSTSYGSQTPTRNAGSGDHAQNVSAGISGLTAGTAYHYRLVATNAAGSTEGADETFTSTTAAPPTATTDAAVAVTAKGAALAGTINPNGAATAFHFEYGTSTSYGSVTPTRQTGDGTITRTAFAYVTGLVPATTYHFRLVATSASGTTDGADQTFSTPALPVLPHAQWFAGMVSAVGSDSLTVGVLWTGPHDDVLNGQSVPVAVDSHTNITNGIDNSAATLSDIKVGDLVGIRATGTSASDLTATDIHIACNCHWIAGTISAVASNSISVQVKATGPYDTVLNGQQVTLVVNSTTTFVHDKNAIGLSDLKIGDGVGVVFGASGFFKAPGFNPATATFTAKQVRDWGQKNVPPASSAGPDAATVTTP